MTALRERHRVDKMPVYNLPRNVALKSFLCDLVARGAREAYGIGAPGPYDTEREKHIRMRLQRELQRIEQMGLIPYVLLVWDLVQYAGSKNIELGPGKRQLGGSAVAYTLGITVRDPTENEQPYESLLHGGSGIPPAFTLQVDDEGRRLLTEYAGWRYGWRHVGWVRGSGYVDLVIADVPLDELVEVTKTERGEQTLELSDQDLAAAGLLKIRLERALVASESTFSTDVEF